jgi:hypothetical protein
LKFELGAYLGFACLPVGREFVIWNFIRNVSCSIGFAIFPLRMTYNNGTDDPTLEEK